MVKFANLNPRQRQDRPRISLFSSFRISRALYHASHALSAGKGGKNRRRGKNENETEKRELVFKEDGQGEGGKTIRYDVDDAMSTWE